MAPDLHTPLESYLLFETLHSSREQQPPPFGTISQSLKTNNVLRESHSFSVGRLEPDALKSLYLRSLKEEARADLVSHDQNGQVVGQTNSRKRKLGSPPVETLDEAVQYLHLLPQLLRRLYLQYYEHTVKAIESEETKYRSLKNEIQIIEREALDMRVHRQDAARRNSQGVPSIQNLLRETEEDSRPQVDHNDRPASNAQPRADASRPMLNGNPSHPKSTENVTPYLPPPQHSAHGYPLPSPSGEVYRRKPPQPHAGPAPSPRTNQNSLPAPERSPASPIILPPPPGMLRTSGSPSGPLDALADMAGQQYRASPAMPSPRQVQPPPARQHPHQLPTPRNYPTGVQQPYPVYDSQGYPVPYQPYNQPPVYHPHAGSMQPYPAHGPPYNPSLYQHPGYYSPAAHYPQSSIQTPYNQQGPKFFDHRTPISGASGRLQQVRPTPTSTSTSSTKWKDVDIPGSNRTPGSPIRPRSRDVSPISARGSPVPEEPPTKLAAKKGRRGRPPRNKTAATDTPTAGPSDKKTWANAARRGHGGRTGSVTSSTIADSLRERTRSQSAADELSTEPTTSSHKIKPEPSGASAHDDDASTPSFTADESARKLGRRRRGTVHGQGAAMKTSRTSTKRKRDGPSSIRASTSPPPLSRQTTLASTTSKPGYILGTRNFPRASNHVHAAIVAHRVGSMFSKPLSDRNAPGYKDMIYRPQDLKSIKAAISAGGRALIAAAEESIEPAGASTVWVPESEDLVPPKGIVNSAQYEKEVMRMFANAVMFNPDVSSNRGLGPAFRARQRVRDGIDAAGAAETSTSANGGVKFEIGVAAPVEGAMVQDTREMFAHVSKIIDEWKALERATEEESTTPAAAHASGGVGTPASASRGRLRGGGDDEADELGGEDGDVRETVEVETVEPGRKRRRK